jgi:hypothetical protein
VPLFGGRGIVTGKKICVACHPVVELINHKTLTSQDDLGQLFGTIFFLGGNLMTCGRLGLLKMLE